MTVEEIKALDGKLISSDEYDNIIESEFVSEVNNVGVSGINPNWTWWDVVTIYDTRIDVYTHSED